MLSVNRKTETKASSINSTMVDNYKKSNNNNNIVHYLHQTIQSIETDRGINAKKHKWCKNIKASTNLILTTKVNIQISHTMSQ